MSIKAIVGAAVLFGAVSLFAQDAATDSSQSPATEVAPAPDAAPVPEVTPAPVVVQAPVPEPAPVVATAPAAVMEKEGIKAVFYGMAMYRFREILTANYRKDEGIESSSDYLNKLAYKIGIKVKINKEVSGQFEVGNDWYATETVEAVTKGNFAGSHRDLYPYFSLAYMKWNPGCFFMDVGIIPVSGSAMLDLIGNGMLADKNSGIAYARAAHNSWGIITNFSIPGARLGVPLLKDEFKLGVEVTTTVLEERSIAARIPDSVLHNNSAVMLMVDLPMISGALTLKPSFIVNLNRFYRDSGEAAVGIKEQADHEYGFGVDAGYRLNSSVCLRLGLGYATMSNENSRLSTDPAIDEEGVNGNVGTTVNLGPGKLNFDFLLSTDENCSLADSRSYFPFVDLKYGWEVNKNFTIMPRARLFFTRMAKSDPAVVTKFALWPELIIYGSF